MPHTPSRLEELCAESGITPIQLARKIGMSSYIVEKWQTREHVPRDTALFKIAESLNLPLCTVVYALRPDLKQGSIEEIRLLSGLTLTDIADELGVTLSTISIYFKGKNKPQYSSFFRIAELFQTSPEHLMKMWNREILFLGDPDRPTLKTLLYLNGLSVSDLAAKLSIESTKLNRLLNGISIPIRPNLIEDLSILLNVEPEVIISAIANNDGSSNERKRKRKYKLKNKKLLMSMEFLSLSYEELSDLSGVPVKTIQDIANGEINPIDTDLNAIVMGLGKAAITWSQRPSE